MFAVPSEYVSTEEVQGKSILKVHPEALTTLSEQAFIDVAHLLRPAHLQVCNKYTYHCNC